MRKTFSSVNILREESETKTSKPEIISLCICFALICTQIYLSTNSPLPLSIATVSSQGEYLEFKEIQRTTTTTTTTTTPITSKSTSRKLTSISSTETDFMLPHRVLVLTATDDVNERTTVGTAINGLNAYNIPFTYFNTVSDPCEKDSNGDNVDHTCNRVGIGLPDLEDIDGNPMYSGIVLTDGGLGFSIFDAGAANNISYSSGITWAETLELRSYAAKWGVRIVSLFGYPSSAPGLVSNIGTSSGTDIYWDQTTLSCDPRLAAGLVTTTNFTLPDSAVWHYRTTFDPSTVAADEDFLPVLRYADDDSVASAILSFSDGREEYQFYVDLPIWTIHGNALHSSWVSWLTRHSHFGRRQVLLSTQLDDFFLATTVWNSTLHRQGIPPYEPSWRMTVDDIDKLIAWKEWILTIMPPGSNWVPEYAYNGYGVEFYKEQNEGEDPLFDHVADPAIRDELYWVSHTWSHYDLTCADSDCAGSGATPASKARSEIRNNQNFTDTIFLQSDETFSAEGLVTPMITGLTGTYGGPTSLEEIHSAGIRYLVGDNTIEKLLPTTQNKTLYDGYYTTEEEFGFDGIWIIPRFATYIYFDAALPDQNIDQFNTIWSRSITFSELTQDEAQTVIQYLLGYRPDPYMFHQANTVFFDYEHTANPTGQSCLLCAWVEDVVMAYKEYSNLPLITLTHDGLGKNLMERATTNNCNMEIYYVYEGRNITALDITSGAEGDPNLAQADQPGCNDTVIYFTGFRQPANTSWPTDLTLSTYGPDTVLSVPISPNQSRYIPVEPAVGIYDKDTTGFCLTEWPEDPEDPEDPIVEPDIDASSNTDADSNIEDEDAIVEPNGGFPIFLGLGGVVIVGILGAVFVISNGRPKKSPVIKMESNTKTGGDHDDNGKGGAGLSANANANATTKGPLPENLQPPIPKRLPPIRPPQPRAMPSLEKSTPILPPAKTTVLPPLKTTGSGPKRLPKAKIAPLTLGIINNKAPGAM